MNISEYILCFSLLIMSTWSHGTSPENTETSRGHKGRHSRIWRHETIRANNDGESREPSWRSELHYWLEDYEKGIRTSENMVCMMIYDDMILILRIRAIYIQSLNGVHL